MKIPTARKLPSGSWFIQLRIDGQSVSVTEPTEERCVAKAMAIKAGLLEVKRKPADITLSQAIDNYIELRRNILSPSTIRGYKTIQDNRFPALMKTPLSAITPQKIQAAVNSELKSNANGKRTSAKTISNSFGLIKTVLMENMDMDFSRIALPKKELHQTEILSPDEVGKLLVVIKGHAAELPILLALWLGLRRSEIAALRKKDFNFKKKTVSITSALVQNEKNKFVEKGTKTTLSTRTLSCPQYILDKVSALPDDNAYIVKSSPGALVKALHRICEANGLPIIRLHDLRHVNASIMLMLNVPDKYAMERGGWSSKKTMTGRYQHTYDSEHAKVNDTINNYYAELLNANENANG